MTEQAQAEQATEDSTFEKLKARYDKANIGGQAVIRASVALSTILDSQLDRRVKADAMIALLKSLVVDIEIGAYERLFKAQDIAPSSDMKLLVSRAALLAIDISAPLSIQFANIMELFVDELKQRQAAKQAEPVA